MLSTLPHPHWSHRMVMIVAVLLLSLSALAGTHAASLTPKSAGLAAGAHTYHLIALGPALGATNMNEAFGSLTVTSSASITGVLTMGNGDPITITGSLAAGGATPISLTLQTASAQWQAQGSMGQQQRLVGTLLSGTAPVGGFLLVPGALRSFSGVEVRVDAGRDAGRSLHGAMSFVVDLTGAVFGEMVNTDGHTAIAVTGHAQGHQVQFVLPVSAGNTLPHGGTFLVQGSLVHKYAHWFYRGAATGPGDTDSGEFTALY